MHKKRLLFAGIGLLLLLTGCGIADQAEEKEKSKEVNGKETEQIPEYVSVEEYTGEGFTFKNGNEESDRIAEENREDIEIAVKQFMLDKYKTQVGVHNIVGAIDYASVYVEAKEPLSFYTFVNVPVDIKNEQVNIDRIWTLEGEVEVAMWSALYGLVFEDGIEKLQSYLESVADEYGFVGERVESLQNVGGRGFAKPYFYVSVSDPQFRELYERYLANPDMDTEEMKAAIDPSKIDPAHVSLTIDLYMKEKGSDPNREMMEKVKADTESMDGLPPGTYSVYLNDNDISTAYGMGTKPSQINTDDYIVKE